MREITTHKINGLNDALNIQVLNDPVGNKDNHQYCIKWRNTIDGTEPYCFIGFQKGLIHEVGVNGVSNEALLAIVRDRLECFQLGEFACDENEDALKYVVGAMRALAERTAQRGIRGVIDTLNK